MLGNRGDRVRAYDARANYIEGRVIGRRNLSGIDRYVVVVESEARNSGRGGKIVYPAVADAIRLN